MSIAFRIGGNKQPWIAADPAFDKEIAFLRGISRDGETLIIDNFDWNTQVEFAFVVCPPKSGIQIDSYVEKNKSYYRPLGSVTMEEIEGFNCKGPDFSKLVYEYVGRYDKKFESLVPIHTPGKNENKLAPEPMHQEQIKEIISWLDESSDQEICRAKAASLDSYLGAALSAKHRKNERFYFVAYQNAEYTNLKGCKINSIMPFGSGKLNSDGLLMRNITVTN